MMDLKTGDRVQMIGGSRVFVITDDTVNIGDWDVPCLTVADTEGNQTIMEWEFFLANFESLTEYATCPRCQRDYSKDRIERAYIAEDGYCQICHAELIRKFASSQRNRMCAHCHKPLELEK